MTIKADDNDDDIDGENGDDDVDSSARRVVADWWWLGPNGRFIPECKFCQNWNFSQRCCCSDIVLLMASAQSQCSQLSGHFCVTSWTDFFSRFALHIFARRALLWFSNNIRIQQSHHESLLPKINHPKYHFQRHSIFFFRTENNDHHIGETST